MKKLNYQYTLLFTLLFIATISAQEFRKYGIKSGFIEYKLSGDASGTTTATWDDWGRKELQTSNSKTSIMGITNEENKTTLMLGTDMYSWVKGKNTIQKSKNPIADILGKEDYDENDLESFSKKSLKSLGYKKTGEETIDGKNCDVYEGMAGKMWLWKDNQIALKVDISLLGMSMISEVINMDLNKSVDASLFEIPKGMEIVEGENVNYNHADSDAELKVINSMVKDLLKGGSSGKKDSSKTNKNESDENFTEELLEETKDAAVEGVKEGAKETAKDVAKEEAKKATKKTVKSILNSIF